MLYVVGLGLADEKDITVRGLEAVQQCDRIYLEAYTSILLCEREKLEQFYGKAVVIADRELVESGSDDILEGAETLNIAFLVVGDPFGATTHTDLIIRARDRNIPVEVIHNASIMNAIGACGLQLYNFGQCVSLVFFTDTWRPASFYDRVAENRAIGLHTLMLLDIKVKEQSIENMARGRRIYEPPRYMTVKTACEQMLEIADAKIAAGETPCYTQDTLAVGVGRVGSREQVIVAGTLRSLMEAEMGPPLHSMVVLGDRVHPLELEYMKYYATDPAAIQALIDEKEGR
ncbi:tetrapyrrole methylase [Protomyces lactucae-debilis]|uniref:diphthine methyl ester synthase n=1 Tax=Protomyces lactucae-debilis TaxID=2754530 RepID=A0A1Y2F1I9_PROLT|nr:tetrapyrrole methylase [Protomyces lactucae-debilis]ORY77751.1 tetrapyrrole methylase [Protomyces lactucae-debilis]